MVHVATRMGHHADKGCGYLADPHPQSREQSWMSSSGNFSRPSARGLVLALHRARVPGAPQPIGLAAGSELQAAASLVDSSQLLLLGVVISALAAPTKKLSPQMGAWDVMEKRCSGKAHIHSCTHYYP